MKKRLLQILMTVLMMSTMMLMTAGTVSAEENTVTADPFLSNGDRIETDVSALRSENWMSGVSGERYLNEINIPGTHDSGCKDLESYILVYGKIGYIYAITQDYFINKQLELGTRLFDIRLNNWYEDHVTWHGDIDKKDDGKNLWLCHGKTGAGTFYCQDENDHDTSFDKVLTWMKDFLKAHPTETVIIDLQAENKNSDDVDTIYRRAGHILKKMKDEINPSTGEPYLYMDGLFEPYIGMPQLKNCRGKIVVMSSAAEKVGIGIQTYEQAKPGSSVSPAKGDPEYHEVMGLKTYYENHWTLSAPDKVKALKDFYNKYGDVKIPTNVESHLDVLYRLFYSSAGSPPGEAPGTIAPNVHKELSKDTGSTSWWVGTGDLNGWIYNDFVTDGLNNIIWGANFPENLEYCTITVNDGNDEINAEQQTFKVLKGTKIHTPGNIYHYDFNELPYDLTSWRYVTASGDSGTLGFDTTKKITEDIEFYANWQDEGISTVQVVWMDGDNKDGLRPTGDEPAGLDEQDLVIWYRADGKLDKKYVVVRENDNWKADIQGSIDKIQPDTAAEIFEISGLYLQGEDKEGKYRYEVIKDGARHYTITLYHTPADTIAFSGTVGWEDDNDRDRIRPDKFDLHLYADQEEVDSLTVTAANGWNYNFGKEYPLYNDGKKIEYEFKEGDITGYGTHITDDFTITNYHSPDTISLAGTVSWDDQDNAFGVRPESITLRVMKTEGTETSETATLEVTAGDYGVWHWLIEGLYKYNNGEEISYSIAADKVFGYSIEVDTPDEQEQKLIEVIATQIHELNKVQRIEPTCTGAGNIEYWKCEVCGKLFKDSEGKEEIKQEDTVIAPTGHVWRQFKYTNRVPATCTEGGSYDRVEECTTCWAELSRTHVTTEPLGHSWCTPTYTWSEDYSEVTARHVCARDASHVETETAKTEVTGTVVPESCEEPGATIYAATFTKEGFTRQTKTAWNIPATGHIPKAEPVIENEVKATCTEGGSYERVTKCAECGKELSRTKVTTAPLGHNWGEWTVSKAATCEEAGEETRSCIRTGCSYKETRDIPATGHDWSEWKVTKEATETEEGEETRTCKNDPSHIETRTIPVKSHVHHLVKVEAKDATCTENGNIEYWVCSEGENPCGRYFKDEDGTQEITIEEIVIPAVAHSWGEGVETTAPGCTTDGVMTYTCTVCNAHKEEAIPMTGHNNDYEDEIIRKPTCEVSGYHWNNYRCQTCGEIMTSRLVKDDPLGHSWGEPEYLWAEDNSTVTATRVCERDGCDGKESETVAAVLQPAKVATCTEAGQGTYTAVFNNEAFEEQSKEGEIPAFGHEWGPWQVLREATCTEDGSRERVCDICGTPASEVIPATGHNWGDPTYEWAGDYSAVTAACTCKNDGSHQESETVKTTAEVTKKATYAAKGQTTYTAVFTSEVFDTQTKTVADIAKLKVKGTTISKLTPAKKGFKVKWKKKSGIKGYQIRYALNSKFTKGKKTVTVKKRTTVSKKITKLKAKKKYYVKIRTYKSVGGEKYYSPWSKSMNVKTR